VAASDPRWATPAANHARASERFRGGNCAPDEPDARIPLPRIGSDRLNETERRAWPSQHHAYDRTSLDSGSNWLCG
jgi:hypothetical protein